MPISDTVLATSINDACLKGGKKEVKNNHLASFSYSVLSVGTVINGECLYRTFYTLKSMFRDRLGATCNKGQRNKDVCLFFI